MRQSKYPRGVCRAIAFVLVAVLAVLTLLACGSDPTPTVAPTSTPVPIPTATLAPTPTLAPSPTPTPQMAPSRETLVPEGSSLMVDARVGDILDSAIFAVILEVMPGGDESGSDLLSEFESELGVSPYSIEFAEAFVDLETVLTSAPSAGQDEEAAAPTIGMALHGEFSEERILESLEEETEGEVREENYRGYQVYLGDTGESDDSAFAFLDSGTLLVGTADGVKAMIDVAEGVADPMPEDALQALDALGDRHVGLILSTPPEMLEGAAEDAGDGMAMLGMLDPTALSSPLTVMSVSFGDTVMEITTRQFFEEEADAHASKEYTEGTMSMLGVMVDSPEIQELVAGMTLEQSGLALTSSLSIDEGQFKAIFGFLTGLMAMEPDEPQS